jgi:hypothetical protein
VCWQQRRSWAVQLADDDTLRPAAQQYQHVVISGCLWNSQASHNTCSLWLQNPHKVGARILHSSYSPLLCLLLLLP